MACDNFSVLFKEIFNKNKLEQYITNSNIEKFKILYEKLIIDNKKFNLTALTDEEDVILKHFADSLLICELIPQNASLIDIGCGAGFPSLPLAIVSNDINILALDSTAKKIEYVNETASLLGLTNIKAISERAEILGNDVQYREKFDIATARAVAALPILAELCIPFVKKGGAFIAMKSQSADEEQEKSESIIKQLGCDKGTTKEYHLVGNQVEQIRKIIIYKKVTVTDNKYPRNYSQIVKQMK